MSPERARFTRTAIAASALVVIERRHSPVRRVHSREQLFAGSAWGAMVAAATALADLQPFYAALRLARVSLAAFAFWIVSQRKRRALRKCA